jgi:hypothetical protein
MHALCARKSSSWSGLRYELRTLTLDPIRESLYRLKDLLVPWHFQLADTEFSDRSERQP